MFTYVRVRLAAQEGGGGGGGREEGRVGGREGGWEEVGFPPLYFPLNDI